MDNRVDSNHAARLDPAGNHAYPFVAVSIGDTDYYINRREIRTLVSVQQLENNNNHQLSVGTLTESGLVIPVYCLSSQLDLLQAIPESMNICILFRNVNFALLCSDLRSVTDSDVVSVPLPHSLLVPNLPICSLCMIYDKHGDVGIGNVVSEYSLRNYINSLRNDRVAGTAVSAL